jgi:hypothetical protein
MGYFTITKDIHVDQEIEMDIELDSEDVLQEIDTTDILEYLLSNATAKFILDRMDNDDILDYIAKEPTALSDLLRKLADMLDRNRNV